MTALTRKTPWDKRQVRQFVKNTRERFGKGWDYLVPEIQIAVVRSEALSILQSQHRDQIPVANIDWLVYAMLEEAGFGDEFAPEGT